MDDAMQRYEEICDQMVVRPGVSRGKAFGMPCLKVSGKMFAGFFEESMTFKLTGEPHGRALSLPGARLFDPGMGRPMKEWVQVPFTQGGAWEQLALNALEYVASLISKE
jgi:hypothetical protein